MSKRHDVEHITDQALTNIKNDRQDAKEFLDKISDHLRGNPHEIKELANSAAKVIENLQRSNEQLVKIISELNKKKPKTDNSFSEEELQGLKDSLMEN